MLSGDVTLKLFFSTTNLAWIEDAIASSRNPNKPSLCLFLAFDRGNILDSLKLEDGEREMVVELSDRLRHHTTAEMDLKKWMMSGQKAGESQCNGVRISQCLWI
uniref:Uncharacterized protein n=1 Tax=Opuntia streptacantha TaxID=393608 RepID=A0A7C9CZW3_OPUST